MFTSKLVLISIPRRSITALVGSFILLTTSLYSQTCVILRITPTKITVGADSRRTFHILIRGADGKRKEIKRRDVACKIGNIGDRYYALAGSPDHITRRVANESCKTGRNIEDVASRYSSRMGTALQMFWDSVRKIDTFYYKNNIKPCEIAFFWVQDNKPKVAWVVFYPVNVDPRLPAKFENAASIFTEKEFTHMMGEYEAIKAEASLKSTWLTNTPESAIKKLILKQSKVTPDIVGEPIDIVQVTQSGVNWLTKRRVCKD